jgi:hypothetical protein
VLDRALYEHGTLALVREVYEELERRSAFRVSNYGCIDHFRGNLALRLNLVGDAGQHFRSGLEWCERERCPVEAGRALLGLGEVAQRRGEREQAREYLDRSGELFSQYGAKLYLDQVIAKKEILKA